MALTIGGVLVYSGIKGLSILEVLAGETGTPLDPRGGRHTVGDTKGSTGGVGPALGPMNTPQGVIEGVVIPMAQRRGINVTAESVRAANKRHSRLTLTGGRSDHSGPGDERWAIDAAGDKAAMAELANDIAEYFGLNWDGSGAVSGEWQNFDVQLIHRSMVGGNHYTHVHFGLRVRRDQKR